MMYITQTISLKELLGREMSLIPEVDAVYVSREERTYHVWVVIDQCDRSIREKIYQREMSIITEFGSYEFDFNILSRRGRDLSSVIQDSILDAAFVRKGERCNEWINNGLSAACGTCYC
jgi:hypothetical protein